VPALEEFDLRSLPLQEALDGATLALIVTAHSGIDYDAIAESVDCVFDLRGVTQASASRGVVHL
jgi:UDP-N-acetyl-D-mannosaminuronate dehydrogenase